MSSLTKTADLKQGIRESPNGKWAIFFGLVFVVAFSTRRILEQVYREGDWTALGSDIFFNALLVQLVAFVLAIIAFIMHRNQTESTRWIIIGIPAVFLGIIVVIAIIIGIALTAL